MSLTLPHLDDRVTWSIHITDAESSQVLATHQADVVCRTASIGKIFLLIEVARRIVEKRLDPRQPIVIPEEHFVKDSGLLYRMLGQQVSVYDAAVLVGAVSDNLATNALIQMCGLDAVHAVSAELGYTDSALLDYIRNERGPELPWTPSYGTAFELSDLMARLDRNEILNEPVCQLVGRWLAADTDTSMVAAGFLLDPLAHDEPEYQGMELRHKTGSTSFARIDVGILNGPERKVAYAVAANWPEDSTDLRAPVLQTMQRIGNSIRGLATGMP